MTLSNPIVAGNTVETLKPRSVEEIAAEIAKDTAELTAQTGAEAVTNAAISQGTEAAVSQPVSNDGPLQEYVTREEFEALLGRINKFNQGAPRRI